MDTFDYQWENPEINELAVIAVRAGEATLQQQRDLVLALVHMAAAYAERIDAEEGEGAHSRDEYCLAARQALVQIVMTQLPIDAMRP